MLVGAKTIASACLLPCEISRKANLHDNRNIFWFHNALSPSKNSLKLRCFYFRPNKVIAVFNVTTDQSTHPKILLQLIVDSLRKGEVKTFDEPVSGKLTLDVRGFKFLNTKGMLQHQESLKTGSFAEYFRSNAKLFLYVSDNMEREWLFYGNLRKPFTYLKCSMVETAQNNAKEKRMIF